MKQSLFDRVYGSILLIIIPLFVLLLPLILSLITGNKDFYWGFTFSWLLSFTMFIVGMVMCSNGIEEKEICDCTDCKCDIEECEAFDKK